MAGSKLQFIFKYEALNPATQEIRLSSLQPGTINNQPRCEIEVMSLQQESNYVALSYLWWDEKDRRDILLREHSVSVTANLDLALRYVQCIKELPHICVDALCITK
jgi:hypothetical protein